MNKTRNLPAWTPFVQTALIPLTKTERETRIDDIVSRFPQMSRDEASAALDDVNTDTVFVNSRYQVNGRIVVNVPPFGMIAHLSIKRLDKDRPGANRYRDFMRIKDELTDPKYEAVEIYPARSDEIDTANQYHLWVFVSDFKLPFGWHGQRVVDGNSPIGGKQEPL